MYLASILLAAATSALPPSDDWIVGLGAGNCSATDVDFSDSTHGVASCAFSNAMTTSDGGLNWTVFPTGLQQSLVFAHAESASELYLARSALYRSINGGANWNEIGNLSANGGSVFDVYVGGSQLVAVQGGNVRYSTDGGATWQIGFAAQQNVFLDELHFPSAQVGYASGGITTELGSIGSVVRTQDGGVTWSLLNFPFGQITAADFIDESHGVVATLASSIYSTADQGTSWQLIGNVPNAAILLDVAQRSARHWYGAASSGCIYETFDAGASWAASFCDPSGRALAAITLDSGAAVAVGNDGLVVYENRVFRAGFD